MELNRFGTGALHLVVNRVRKKMLYNMHTTIDDAIDKAGLPLLGVVPEDDVLPLSLHRGIPPLLDSYSSPASRAYKNISRRLLGIRTPLLRIK
jgi:septum site-determining protein MinD